MLNSICDEPYKVSLPVNETKLKGGALFSDETNGKVELIFSEYLTSKQLKRVYEIKIDNLRVSFPTTDWSHGPYLCFIATQNIHCRDKGNYIEIIEKDKHGQSHLFVDMQNTFNETYRVYSHIPTPMTLDIAKDKMRQLIQKFHNFQIEKAIFNQHGVVLFGLDTNILKNYCLWASPSSEDLSCLECEVRNEDLELIISSTDGNILWRSQKDEHSLNDEPATILTWK